MIFAEIKYFNYEDMPEEIKELALIALQDEEIVEFWIGEDDLMSKWLVENGAYYDEKVLVGREAWDNG
jgi:uncharacterized protein YukJ